MFKKFVIRLILLAFFSATIGPLPDVSAQSIIGLPSPGVMVSRSNPFDPLQLKGILLNVKNPLRFDFLVDKGDSGLYGQPLKDDITRLAKYFLTCLTVPEDDLWVNLSPYEKDRIVPGNFGITLMGKDLLEQDYLLKQMMASLSYPENELGRTFWQKIYRKSSELYGTTDIPINTFNKVWIVPKTAEVYVQGNTAFVVNSQLDVMLEADYKSFIHHLDNKNLKLDSKEFSKKTEAYSQVFRDVILPELRQEINEGKNFGVVRQVYNAMILATWYKRHLKDSLLGKMYVGQNKVAGVDIADKNAKEKIFQLYLKAYKKCVYSYIKEDYDLGTNQTVPRKYASGGMYFAGFGGPKSVYRERPNPQGMRIGPDLAMATVDVSATNVDGKIISFPDMRASITNTSPFHQIPIEARKTSLSSPDKNRVLNDLPMFMPRFFRPLILTVGLAVAGIIMTSTTASAAIPVSPSIHITVKTKTQDLVGFLDQQIVSYKKSVRSQESLLNILNIRGNPDDSNRVLSGLVEEDAQAHSLLAAGKSMMDWSDLEALDISRLKGQIGYLDGQIKQREQKINDGVLEFKNRERSHDMHAAEVSMRQGNIRYNEGVLRSFIAQKVQLSSQIKVDQDNQVFSNQVVSNAVASGVNPVVSPAPVKMRVPLPTELLTSVEIPASLSSLTNPHVSAGNPPPPKDTHSSVMLPVTQLAQTNLASVVLPLVAQSASTNAPSVKGGIFNLTTSLGNNNGPFVSPSFQIVKPPQMQVSSVNAPPSQAGILSSTRFPSGGNVAAGSRIPSFISEGWAWYAGFALLGISLVSGGLSILKKNKLKNQPFKGSSDKYPRISPKIKGQSGNWEFNVVTTNGPAIPDEEELAWQRKQQQAVEPAAISEAPPIPVAEDNQFVQSGLRVMDVLGFILSTGLAAIYSGGDLNTMSEAFLSSLFVTRLFYAGYTFIHENGHSGIALIQSPKNYKRILTAPNFFVNYNLSNWLRLIFAFGKPAQLPGVDLPLTGKARRFNQTAGFIVTATVSGLAFLTAVKTGLWLPLFGSLSVASLYAILNSWKTDIRNPSSDGRINCGDSGFIWLPRKFKSDTNDFKAKKAQAEDFFPGFVQNGLTNMRVISGLRGDQGKGLFTLAETRQGDVVPVGFKVLKDKRGKPVAEVAQKGFTGTIQEALNQDMRPLETVREVMTHDRFLTQGIPSRKGLHPHPGFAETRTYCFYTNGIYQKKERTILSIVIENGDNNFHKKHGRIMPTREIREFYPIKFHMKKDVFIEPNPKFPNGYYDYLPSGDAPALALQEQWYDNQGDWWSASRFAADEVFYKNDKEAMEYNLSKDEVNAMGDFYMRVFENGHEQILIRPGLKKKNKTLTDSWVSEETAKNDEKFAFQYKALQDFRADLKSKLMTEAINAKADENKSEVGHILNRLQQLHPEENFEEKVDRFVNMTVERFFIADILEAAKEIDKLELEGAYGVRVISSKYPGRGVFWTKGQSIALGVNKEAGYIAYNSEHTALMSRFGDAPPVKEILFLNSEGQGQITETNYNEETQDLDVRAWSPEKGRFLIEDELKEWRMELNSGNTYWTPLVERDSKTVTDEDIDDITKVTDDAVKRWRDPKSFVRQSAADFFDKLASRYVESYIKNNSRFYKVMEGNLLYYVEHEAQQCHGGQCNSEEYQLRVAALLREIQNDSRVLSYLKSRLDQLVAYEADLLSRQIRTGEKTEDNLFLQLKRIDEGLSEHMFRNIKILTENLISNNVKFLSDFQNEQGQLALHQKEIEVFWNKSDDANKGKVTPSVQGDGLPKNESIGSGESVIFASGIEDSLWIGAENFKAMMQVFFPKMPIETESSNKALDLRPGDRYKVGRRTLGLVVSKSGATSPSKNLVNPLKQIITTDDLFAMTGRPDSLLGLSLGQKYYTGAPFTKRILPTGNNYPTEVNSVSEVELLVNQIEFVLYIVKRMKKMFPNQRPWGMDVSDENIQKIEQWRDNLVNKSRRLTGVDEQGNPGTYPEHEKIIHDGRIFGKMITETPLSNLGNRAYVFSIIYLGVPIGALAAYIERKTGLSVHSSGLGHLIWALLDTTLACSMPWWITTRFYRLFSGRVQRWARLGPPKVVLGDIPVLHQAIEISASKRSSLAIGSMDVDIHGGNPQDHFGPRFLHRVRRGTIEIFGLPEDPHSLSNVLLTDSQSNVRTDISIGWKMWDWLGRRFKAGPEIFTIGPGDVDPNSSQHHMSTGALETVSININGERELRADVTDTLARFHALSFEVFDRLTTYNVFFNEAFRWATNWGPFQVHKQGESYSRTGVLSTPSPKGGPKQKLPEFHDSNQHYSANRSADSTKADLALLSDRKFQQAAITNGGINMSSRLMKLNITGDPKNRTVNYDNSMVASVVNGVVLQVSGIVTVTPDMLKAMLGEGYLN